MSLQMELGDRQQGFRDQRSWNDLLHDIHLLVRLNRTKLFEDVGYVDNGLRAIVNELSERTV